jgi:hypothetical protein
VVIKSDLITQLSYKGAPSWSFNYIDESGQEVPFMDPFVSQGVARWEPDVNAIQKKLDANKSLYMKSQLNRAQDNYDRMFNPKRRDIENDLNPINGSGLRGY